MGELPWVMREVEIGGRMWRVETVEDQGALLAASEGRAQFPFGLMLWESAVALAAEFAARPEWVRGRSVLELGCGVGLAGVVAAALSARVVQTDHDPAALEAARRTGELNGVRDVRVEAADWHAWNDAAAFDLIIAADVIYDAADHQALLDVMDRALAPGGRALLADPGREAQGEFIARAGREGWRVVRSECQVADLSPNAPAGAEIAVTIVAMARAQGR